jgi:sulfur carrier protein ThiS
LIKDFTIAEEFMNTVQLQLYSWTSQTLGMPVCEKSILDKKVKEGTSVSDLFSELAEGHPEFRKLVFDPATLQMGDQVLVILNNTILQASEIPDTKLNNNDVLTLSPVLFGG